MWSAKAQAALLACLLAGPAGGHVPAEEDQPPNIVFILADDAGLGDFGCYGGERIQTPAIDRLAAEGMRFTRFYSGSSVCIPSRCVLMTGKHAGSAAIRNNATVALPEREVTLAEHLRRRGYATGVIGKWALGRDRSGTPLKHGFQEFFGFIDQIRAHRYYPEWMWRNRQKVTYPGNPEKRTHYAHDLFTDEALDFVERHRDEPFFLYLAYTVPHPDLDVPEDSMAPYREAYGSEEGYEDPYEPRLYRDQPEPRAAYAGMISRLDRDVGRLMARLSQLQLDERTVVFFSSDNGATRAGGVAPEFFASTAGLRGGKRDLFEGGIRAPLVVRWPGRISAGTENELLSGFWDVLPTCLELAGAEVPEDIDGLSISPTLIGDGEQLEHEFLYWELTDPEFGGMQAARRGDWKIVRTRAHEKQPVMALFDLSKDPTESTDLSSEEPEIFQEMRGILRRGHTPSTAWPLLFREYRAAGKRRR